MIRSLSIKHSVPAKTGQVQISTPKGKKGFQTKLKGNIILVCKFSFNAEVGNELSINKGDIVKLLHKQGNGWLLVKFIDRMDEPGLVPAKYMDIMMNDVKNPVTLNWLHSTDGQIDPSEFLESNYLDVQVKNLLKTNPPMTINNVVYPLAVNISRLFLFNDRYWYCVEVILSDHTTAFLSRYYENFYNLHSSLLERMNTLSTGEDVRASLRLPRLPEPVPRSSEDMTSIIIKRCDALNNYLNSLIRNENYVCSKLLLSWIDVLYNDLPGFVEKTNSLSISREDISNRLLPGSIDVIKQQQLQNQRSQSKATKALSNEIKQAPKQHGTRSNGSLKRKNTYNHYQQVSKFNYPSNFPPTPQASPDNMKIKNAGQL